MSTSVHTMADFLYDLEHQRQRTRWGRWRLNIKHDSLEYWGERGMLYWIDLKDASASSAACLDWIFQLNKKSWMSDQDRADLLHAIEDTISPQSSLCSWRIEQKARCR